MARDYDSMVMVRSAIWEISSIVAGVRRVEACLAEVKWHKEVCVFLGTAKVVHECLCGSAF